jgi:hypothetical protein
MRTGAILATVIVVLLALPVAVYAQEMDPLTVSEAFVADINEGNLEAATNAVAPEAVVEAPQAMSGEAGQEGTDPAAQEQQVGKAEVEAWIEGQMSANGQTTLDECTVVEGEIVICDASFTSDALVALGVDVIEGELKIQVNAEGKIQAYDFTPSAESVAELQAAAPEAAVPEVAAPEEAETDTMPATGGNSLLRLAFVLVLAGLIAVGVLGVWLLQRRWRRAY